MSTRGCVGVVTEKGYEAIYNHWDSYPSRLGFEVYKYLVEKYIKKGKSFEDFKKELLKYTDWREFLNGGVCQYCGKKGLGQPVSISGVIFGLEADADPYIREQSIKEVTDNYIKDALKRTGYPDPDAKYHEHTLDGSTVEETHITPESNDPLFIEWMYIIHYDKDKDKWYMDVYSHNGYGVEGGKFKEEVTKTPDGKYDYGHCVYWHEDVGTIEIDPQMDDAGIARIMNELENQPED